MNTPVITVNNEGSGFDEALALSEKLGLSCGLDKKQNLRLRLLTEELFGLVKNIAGELNGSFSIEYEGRLRKYYHITEQGLARIEAFKEEWKEIMMIYEFVTKEGEKDE